MRKHSYENDFDLHENETAGRTHFHIKGFALRLKAQENSEMAYFFDVMWTVHDTVFCLLLTCN